MIYVWYTNWLPLNPMACFEYPHNDKTVILILCKMGEILYV